jgi:suppressor of tumorigenicity protein 13
MDDIDEEDVDGEYDEPMRDPTPEPDELDEEILESDIELEADGVVEPDHDDTPQKVPPFALPCSALLCSSLVPRN